MAAETFDWPVVTAVADEYVEHLRRSASTPDLPEVREILEMLRAHLRYDELRRVADAALGAGLEHAGAFTLASFLHQLVEVWQLSTAEPPGEHLLPVLRSALLERNGGSVHVSTRTVARPGLRL